LSQLNRSVEQQKPYIPSLSNLRDSGAIEQNAHIVMLLYRKQYYVAQGMLEDDGEEGDYLDIYVSKNREGANGMVRTRFDGPTFSIRDVSPRVDFVVFVVYSGDRFATHTYRRSHMYGPQIDTTGFPEELASSIHRFVAHAALSNAQHDAAYAQA